MGQYRRYARAMYNMGRRAIPAAFAAGGATFRNVGQRTAFRGPGSYTRTGTRRNFQSTGVVSNQYDVKTWYKKKNMPRGKKRKWKTFSKQVKAVLNKEIAPTIKLLRETGSFQTNTNTQNWGLAIMYTCDGTVAPNNDITECKLAIVGSGGNDFATKYRFESACLDLLIRNDTDTWIPSLSLEPIPRRLVIDMYHVVCRQDIPISLASNLYNLIGQTFNYANDDADTIDDGKILLDDIGAVLFHNPIFCRYFKILKKQAIQLGPGQHVELQMRDPKNRSMYGLQSEQKLALKGWTKGFIYSIRGIPQVSGPSGAQSLTTPAVHVSTGYTRSYVMRPLKDYTIATGLN